MQERSGFPRQPRVPQLDRLARYAAQSLQSEIGLITLIQADRQVFLADHGLTGALADTRQTPLAYSICVHVVAMKQPLRIEDGYIHPLVDHNRAVTELGIVSYLGHPVHAAPGHCIGAICVCNTSHRDWSRADQRRLSLIAQIVDKELARMPGIVAT